MMLLGEFVQVGVLALITWLGFRQESVEYDKQPRTAGQSGWTLSRKIKLVVDSVTSFSDFPIRIWTYVGLTLMIVGVVGEYVWRSLEESRRRPAYLIEAVAGQLEPAKRQ